MRPASDLARLALVLALGCPVAVAADEPPTCDGIPLHGTPAEIAATPRARLALEQLAVLLSGEVVAPAATYDRLLADEQQIAALFPEQASSLFFDPPHDFRTLRIDFTPSAFVSFVDGDYTAWDCLNDWYGVAEVKVVDSFSGIVDLVLDGTYDVERLALDYATLAGVESASEIAFGSIMERGACVLAQGDLHHVFLRDPQASVGDCGWSGCHFTTEPGRLPVLRGRTASYDCLHGASTRTLPLELATAPPAPLAGGPVTLEIDGLVATCGVELEGIHATADGFDVVIEALFGCLPPPTTFSLAIPVGPLPADPRLLRVLVRVDPESPKTEGLIWIEPRTEGEAIAGCPGAGPGATLLVPYFEVDLAHAGGRTTLVAVGNASPEPERVRVVLWTDRGFPSLGFSFDLGPDAVETINLRDVFLSGTVPLPGGVPDPPPAPECNPALSDAERADLVAKHLGQPASDGHCYGAPAAEADVATGWITVDVVNHTDTDDCSAIRFPGDAGYFEAGGTGLAANRNALWGDVIYVATGDDSAQGVRAVAIPADDRLGDGDPTFYAGWVGGSGADGRLPLGRLYRSRFLDGGPLDTSSELLVWTEGTGQDTGLATCGAPGLDPERLVHLAASSSSEGGTPDQALAFPLDERRIRRLAVGEAPLLTGLDFGQLEVGAFSRCGLCEFVDGDARPPLQTWVIPVLRAEGRFSVATDAARLDAVCD